MQPIPPEPSENKHAESPAFIGRDGSICIRDRAARGGWRKPEPRELPVAPLWRIEAHRDEG